MNHKDTTLLAAAVLFASGTANAGPGAASDTQALANRYITESFLPGENQDLGRLKQDATLQACNKYRDNPPKGGQRHHRAGSEKHEIPGERQVDG